MANLVKAVPDDALPWPTPCERYTVGDLLDHIAGFAVAFTAAARKTPLDGAGSGDARRLAPDWPEGIPRDLAVLGQAWQDPEAWTGMSAVGGVDLPGEVAGVVALDELVLHGWDLAKAIGQPATYDGPGLDAVHDAVGQFRDSGIFGPTVDIADGAPRFDRILGLAGRDPAWVPTALNGRAR